MIKIIYPPETRATAEKLIADLAQSGLIVEPLASSQAQTADDVLIALITPAVQTEKTGVVQSAIYTALDNSQQIVPITLNGAQPLKLIDHLSYVDFTNGDDPDGVRALIADVTAPGAKLPLKVLTPHTRQNNRRLGWIIAVPTIGSLLYSRRGAARRSSSKNPKSPSASGSAISQAKFGSPLVSLPRKISGRFLSP